MRRKRILIIDDELFIAHILEFCLSMEGYDVVVAADGENISEIVDGRQLDLAIIDFALSDSCGLDIVRELHSFEHLNELPIILLTAESDEIDSEQVNEAGVGTIVTKPISTPELTRTIKILFEAIPIESDQFAGID